MDLTRIPIPTLEEARMPVASSVFTLDVERNGTTSVVRCHGNLVAGVGNILHSKVCELLPVSKRIVLDLKDVEKMDSMGLGTLVRSYVSTRSAGCELVLTHLGQRVRELLGITHLLTVFTEMGERGIKMGF